ncbi:hypothetical protein I4U23_010237 [Adineta vaga]|nr:hypothetical protein I4U23_010237 [Adineta vaga]
MNNTSNSILFLLILSVQILFLLSLVDCTNDEMKIQSIDKTIETNGIKNHLYDTIKQIKSQQFNEKDQEIIEDYLDNLLKPYPHRRASSFHAMRGKRFLRKTL